MKKYASLVLILTTPLWAVEDRAKNVILFIGDTLIIFTADHSFDTRLKGGKKGEPLLPPENTPPLAKPMVRVDGGHTGEEVLVAAQGPGADKVKGFFPNTHLFQVMMAAYGWNAGDP